MRAKSCKKRQSESEKCGKPGPNFEKLSKKFKKCKIAKVRK